MHIAWPEIESFHNVRKYTSAHPEILNGNSVVVYKAKVKLHGTNSAIQCHQDGNVIAQSRTSEITPSNDNAGFARWVEENKDKWNLRNNHVIYGEWIGPGIQKGVAVAQIPKKCFAVFAARSLEQPDVLIVEPHDLQHIVSGIPDTYVLPWHYMPRARGLAELEIDWSKSNEELTKALEPVNDWVAAIEANDPWVESTFGVKGTGEGLVFYPVSRGHEGYTNFSNLCFKAKGEAHKNIKTAAPAQVNPETAASVDAFVELVLTQARLEQGATKVALSPGSYDQQQTGKFVQWIVGDVEKETQDELVASNLNWKQVLKPLQTKARQWYLTQAKKL